MREPILASKRLAPGNGYRVPRVLKVEGGLHYIKGNASPYFSLTCTAHRVGFPADHELILQHFPRFADLAALHLCDMDGAPMHAEANAWYWLAGALSGAGERYHGGNDSTGRSAAECLATFARHLRIDSAEAERIRERVKLANELCRAMQNPTKYPSGRTVLRDEIEHMRSRWKTEAAACIARHNLRVFGDTWPAEAAA